MQVNTHLGDSRGLAQRARTSGRKVLNSSARPPAVSRIVRTGEGPMATDIFAKIGDIKGESLDAKHKDEIEVLSFSWGLTNGVSIGAGGGAGAGKATFQDLTIVHNIDKASPLLMKACATG